MVNAVVHWHRLPRYFGAVNLIAFLVVLRQKDVNRTRGPDVPARLTANPDDSSANPDSVATRTFNSADLSSRAWDGRYNDLNDANMGAAHSRFGRNVPLSRAFPEPEDGGLMEPSPRV